RRRRPTDCTPTSSPALAMTPRPPTATLLPYTTLFRSDARYEAQVILDGVLRHFRRGEPRLPAFAAFGFLRFPGQFLEELVRRLGDRKSTRLNSSHVKISYAVFCSKKKTASPWASGGTV